MKFGPKETFRLETARLVETQMNDVFDIIKITQSVISTWILININVKCIVKLC